MECSAFHFAADLAGDAQDHQPLAPRPGASLQPTRRGPFPTVMVLHGSEGAWSGYSYLNAAILAVPFGYSMGGNAWNAGNIQDVPLDRTAEALAALHALPISGKVGLYGVSRGAEHALLCTSLMARDEVLGLPDAVAVHAPSDVICGAFIGANWRDSGDPGWQAWDPALRAWTWKGVSDALLPTMPIEIERYAGPLLLTHGANDTMWSADMTRAWRRVCGSTAALRRFTSYPIRTTSRWAMARMPIITA